MLTATVDDLWSWGPCDPWTLEQIKKMAGGKIDWTALEVLELSCVPPADRLWIVLRPVLIPEPMLPELGCLFAEHVLPIFEFKHPSDTRPREAIAMKRKWVAGEATNNELKIAQGAAWEATEVAREAAREATRAARSATRAARSAVVTAARASDAARAAARSAARAAGEAGEAEEAESVWQIGVVRELLTRLPENGITGDADRQG